MTRTLSLCFLAMTAATLLAQTPRVALLEIEIDNMVSYRADVFDPAKLATAGTIVAPAIANRGFLGFIGIGDIVAVNGKPAKGFWSNRGEVLNPSPTPAATMAVANVPSGSHIQCSIDLFTA
jgi:hypothetical protein